MRHACPRSGRVILKSSGTPKRREAERAAALWEAELRKGSPRKGVDRATWEHLREEYHDLHLVTLRASSITSAEVSLDKFEGFAGSGLYVDEIDHDLAERWKSSMLRAKLKPTTVGRHLTYLRGILRWAVDQGYIESVPRLPKKPRVPKSQRSRGRALTDTEFNSLLKAVDTVAASGRIGNAEQWKFYLRGLWLSGLRLEESLGLSWQATTAGHYVDLGGSVMIVAAEYEKGARDRDLPLTPDFVGFLSAVPERERVGIVFPLSKARGEGRITSADHVSHIVSDIGEESGVVTDERLGKYASAHDLRKTFGTRWAPRVRPMVLRHLMRHESIATTMKFYEGLEARELARSLQGLDES